MFFFDKCTKKKMLIFNFITFTCFIYIIQISETRKVLRIDRFEMLKVSETSPVVFNYFRINFTEKTGSFISADGFLRRDIIGDKLNLELDITRCASQEALDTCEKFKRLKPNNFCHFMDMKGMAWTTFVYSYNPPFKCPFRKGRYIQKDGFFDPNIFNFFPVLGYYWKVQAKFYDDKEFLFETYTELRVVPVSDM